jgi:hypothetical protein
MTLSLGLSHINTAVLRSSFSGITYLLFTSVRPIVITIADIKNRANR